MTCRQAETLVVRRRCGALPHRQAAALDAHLETCAGCRSHLDALRSGTSLLAQIDELPSPAGLAERGLQRHAERQPTWWPRLGSVFVPRLIAAALVAAAVVGALSFQASQRPAGGIITARQPGTGAGGPPEPPAPRGSSGPASGGPGAAGRRPETARLRPPDHGGTAISPGKTSPVASPGARTRSTGLLVDDLRYLDGYDPALTARWTAGEDERREIRGLLERQLSGIDVRDDFVEIPYPRLAGAATDGSAVREAVRKYADEAKVVDARLFRKVTLRLRGTPLSDLCRILQQRTGVSFTASRTVADENVTLFVKEMPARDVMRAVARLFAYRWGRTGEEPGYRYELRQDLRAQIAEEELRSRQVNEMLLSLDDQLAGYRDYLELGPEEIQRRLATVQGAEKYRLQELSGWLWGPLQLYHRLTPLQRQALAAGEELQFRTDARSPELRLPGEWRGLLLPRTGFVLGSIDGQQFIGPPGFFNTPEGPRPTTPLAGLPGAEVGVSLTLKGLHEGELSLEGSVQAFLQNADGTEEALSASKRGGLGSARSPAGSRANNAVLNVHLRDAVPFRQPVTLRPKVTCRWFTPEGRPEDSGGFRVELDGGRGRFHLGVDGLVRPGEEPPHVTTAEVWEAVHDATGMPVVADAYSRLFEASKLEVKGVSRFEALCRLGNAMGVRWQRDGEFLMGRSLDYLWAKAREVPARHLRRWREAREKHGFLPLEDVLEAATLSDRQLDARLVGHVIGHCWGLEEWSIVGEGAALPTGITEPGSSRPYARLLALLSAGQRDRARGQGLAFEELLPAQQEALLQVLVKDGRSPRDAVGARMRVDYAPAGAWIWIPSAATKPEADRLQGTAPFVWGKTPDETLAAARRVHPPAQPGHVHRSPGILSLTFANPATGASWKAGWTGVRIR